MRYVAERLKKDRVNAAYRNYIADSLRGIPQGRYLVNRFRDIIKPEKAEDTRSAEEIAADVIKQAGLIFGEDL